MSIAAGTSLQRLPYLQTFGGLTLMINFTKCPDARTRAMLNEESIYEHPDAFNPDRFVSREDRPAEPDPARVAFGFGRR